MSLVEINYSTLNSAIKSANKMDGFWGCYKSYRDDLKTQLESKLDEWKVPGNEPKNHTYVASAKGNISSKRTELETSAGKWKTLGTNLGNFKTFVETQDKAVATEFEQTSNAYTNYKGIGGFFTWIGDAFFGSFAVDFMNSNKFTRTIADWGKRFSDDAGAWVKSNVIDWFQHGNGRYVGKIIGSLALTTAAIVGTVIAVLGIPFTGGSSAVIAVGCIGAVAGGIGAAISAFNTYYTIKENATALSIKDDPGRARFHGDVSSYSEHVSKHIYSSPEEYQKHAKIGKGLDVTEKVCTVISIGTGLATSFGTKSVETVTETGEVMKKTVFDFSGKNIKQNVLKTFGFKTTKETASVTVIGQEGAASVDAAGQIGDTTIDIVSQTDDLAATQKTIEKTSENAGKIKYTKKVATIDNISASSEYNSVVASNGVVTTEYTEYAAHAERTTKTIDYTNATMSKDKVSKISYYDKLNSASSPAEVKALKTKHTLETTKTVLEKTNSYVTDLSDTNGKNGREIITGIVKKNTFVNAVDKYVYSLPTKDDATWEDYAKGIGGSNAGKVWKMIDEIIEPAA